MTENVSIDPKAAALGRLAQWARNNEQRDLLVCDARKAGATQAEIIATSNLAKQTVINILHAAGLTGDALKQQEQPVQTDTAFAEAKYYPHHSHFISATSGHRRGDWEFEFLPFTGHEKRPGRIEPTADLDTNHAKRDEYIQRDHEYRAAEELWEKARYRRDMTAAVRKAPTMWQAYLDARAAMDSAWAALDTTEHWQRDVLRLRKAHKACLAAAQAWDEIGETMGTMEYGAIYGRCPSHEQIAKELGIAGAQDWDVRSQDDYYRSGPFRPAPGLRGDVLHDVNEQVEHLEEISRLSGTRAEQ